MLRHYMARLILWTNEHAPPAVFKLLKSLFESKNVLLFPLGWQAGFMLGICLSWKKWGSASPSGQWYHSSLPLHPIGKKTLMCCRSLAQNLNKTGGTVTATFGSLFLNSCLLQHIPPADKTKAFSEVIILKNSGSTFTLLLSLRETCDSLAAQRSLIPCLAMGKKTRSLQPVYQS